MGKHKVHILCLPKDQLRPVHTAGQRNRGVVVCVKIVGVNDPVVLEAADYHADIQCAVTLNHGPAVCGVL